MAKNTLWVPDELYEQAQKLPPEVNLSKRWQETLRRLVADQGACTHPRVVCECCGLPVDAGDVHAA